MLALETQSSKWEKGIENVYVCVRYTTYYVSEYSLRGIDDIIELAWFLFILFTHLGVSLLRLVLFIETVNSIRNENANIHRIGIARSRTHARAYFSWLLYGM